MSRAKPHQFTPHLTPTGRGPGRPRRPLAPDDMTPTEFATVIEELGLSQQAAARLLGINERTPRRWMEGVPIPQPVARFLRFLLRAKISPMTVMETLAAE
jgi:DNA-binding transcriptional regulator YiaG